MINRGVPPRPTGTARRDPPLLTRRLRRGAALPR
jgi:hypothetical protein